MCLNLPRAVGYVPQIVYFPKIATAVMSAAKIEFRNNLLEFKKVIACFNVALL